MVATFLCTISLILLASCAQLNISNQYPDASSILPAAVISPDNSLSLLNPNLRYVSIGDDKIISGLIFNFDSKEKGTAKIKSYNNEDSPFSQLTVTLSDGTEITKRFDGIYYPRISVGNIDDEINDEIAVFLENFGSNYGGGISLILKIKGTEILELPSPYYATNENGFNFTMINKDLNNGILIINNGSLKLYEYIHNGPSRYLTMRFDGSTWRIFSGGYGNSFSGVEYVTPDLPKYTNMLSSYSRSGYVNTAVVF